MFFSETVVLEFFFFTFTRAIVKKHVLFELFLIVYPFRIL